MTSTFRLVALTIFVSATNVDASVDGSTFRRSDFKSSPRSTADQHLVSAAATATGAIVADKDDAVSVGSAGSLKAMPRSSFDHGMDPAFSFEASRRVLAAIKERAPKRRREWLNATVELKSTAAKSRVAAADYENKVTKLDATVAMADKGVVHLRQDISNDQVRHAKKIREHLKSMKKDVSLQVAGAAAGGSPVEPVGGSPPSGQMQVESESRAHIGPEGAEERMEAQVKDKMAKTSMKQQKQVGEHKES